MLKYKISRVAFRQIMLNTASTCNMIVAGIAVGWLLNPSLPLFFTVFSMAFFCALNCLLLLFAYKSQED